MTAYVLIGALLLAVALKWYGVKIPMRAVCKWVETGDQKGKFTEFRCTTCGVTAAGFQGSKPKACKRDALGGRK